MMKSLIFTLIAFLQVACPAVLADRSALNGRWGNEKQCKRLLIIEAGTKRAAPFDIQADWISHGDIWCRLRWMSTRMTRDGLVADAYGQCGEDDVRDYRLRFDLEGDQLTLHWNFQVVNGPLKRCTIYSEK